MIHPENLHVTTNRRDGWHVQAIPTSRVPAAAVASPPGDPNTPPDELAAAFVRLIRQLKSRRSPDPAMACLSVAVRLGPVRISTLADELFLDVSTASRHVRNLESAGLLTREPDPADHRATLLTVTPQGEEYLRHGVARFGRTLRAATEEWPDTDVTTLTTLIDRLADNLGALDSKERS
jgi:DNA-binding MarR family transcriptional regulator